MKDAAVSMQKIRIFGPIRSNFMDDCPALAKAADRMGAKKSDARVASRVG